VTTSPSLDDFLGTARREFGFLVSEFGYIERPDTREHPNPFCVCYTSPRATVTVEGIQWGFGVQVTLSSPSASGSSVPLWAVAELRDLPHREPVSSQLAQVSRDAALLRLGAADILRGDLSSFPAAMRVVEHHAAESAKPKQRKLP
jgi:hypothetical protein